MPQGAKSGSGEARADYEVKVDKSAAVVPGSFTLEYPEALRSANVEGEVYARFVVDTSGRVDSLSIEIVRSTHDSFSQSVRKALLNARFTPATIGDRKVRQRVEQQFDFSLTP